MEGSLERHKLTRRELLARTVMLGAAFAVAPSILAGKDAAWATEVGHLKPETLATLVLMARDIYPHDHVADEFYVVAVKGYDTADNASAIEEGVAALNSAAVERGHASYAEMGWELDRVQLLRSMENTPFFQRIRGGLVTGLYNQKEVWPLFGYEGESYSKGGYIDRGFNDINWI